jgi:AraC family transcriptional regulator, arabinose operon regulatory protein
MGAKSFVRAQALGANPHASHIDSRVRKVLQAIEADPSCEIQDLAQMVNLSNSRLSHLFKSTTGISLQSVLSDARLQRAAELLQSTDMAVKEISYHVGYRHAPSFVRAFRNKVGASPNDYRSRQRVPLSDSEPG